MEVQIRTFARPRVLVDRFIRALFRYEREITRPLPGQFNTLLDILSLQIIPTLIQIP